jgi:transcriptional regulator with XRE-family HTH domain
MPRPGAADSRRRPPAMWLWSGQDASAALRSRDLGQILRVYRRINRLSQERLAAVLGYDKTYISMIETHRRAITDVGTLRHIAHTLSVPVHILGVTEPDDATYLAMVQFADSILNLAEIARKSGRAVDAVNELWPLVARLEARAADGFVDRESLSLLGRARVALGVALGTVLPEEKLPTAARWTGQALIVAQRLEDDVTVLAHTLAMHGNELRKARHLAAAIARLRRAVALSQGTEARTTALAMLARAAGEAGHADLFDHTIASYQRELDTGHDRGMFGNRFTFREIRIRGLATTGRASQAAHLLSEASNDVPAAPQWSVIEQVTTGEVLLAVGDHYGAEHSLLTAIAGAETYRLPHQIQRALRVAKGHLDDVAAAGRSALHRLERQPSHLR